MEIISKQNITHVDGTQNKRVSHNSMHGTDLNGNKLPMAVAMIKACVKYYREQNRPLKEIILNERHFQSVEDFCRRHATAEQADLEYRVMTFDGVNVIKASALSLKELDVTFYGEDNNTSVAIIDKPKEEGKYKDIKQISEGKLYKA